MDAVERIRRYAKPQLAEVFGPILQLLVDAGMIVTNQDSNGKITVSIADAELDTLKKQDSVGA